MPENETPTITLPALEIKPIKHSLGHIYHLLNLGGEQSVVKVEDVQISGRRTEKLYHLQDGQKIIVTDRNKLPRPNGVDGVLRLNGTDQPKWLSHIRLETFAQDVATQGWHEVTKEIADGWTEKFNFKAERKNRTGDVIEKGLRPPQIGGLHAIGAHWSLYHKPATVVMPTGTGKTETMLATLVAYRPGTILVAVPSKVLRDQTANKFITLGLLRSLGNLAAGVRNPIVGIITGQPTNEAELDIFERCNVVIGTMKALAEVPDELIKKIAERVDTLIVDEAHHIGAPRWAAFRDHFLERKILQFTATPYRRDGKLVDGKVIYEYPLDAAQRDGYFKKITFAPIYEIDQEAADQAIAQAAVNKLREDDAAGLRHLIMARCANTDRAELVHEIYARLAPDLNPVLVHSDSPDALENLEQLKTGGSRIVVCVYMLGEGFDLPQLKIAAVHDTHKSLAVLLQFTGRFTRSAGINIGDATVIANIADQDVSSALERLYSEDANWNQLLSEYSSEAARAHSELVDFLNASRRLDEPDENETIEISHHLLRPMLSTLTYEATAFRPKQFYKGLPKNMVVHRIWLHEDSNTLYFVVKAEPPIKWTRSRELHDLKWHLFVMHYDENRHLLYLSSTDHDSDYEKMAQAVGATQLISGDVIFRTLGNINRLVFQNVGVKKHGRRNLRYALYTGADVANALSIAEKAGSVKSNLNGTGWEDGERVSIGCSFKGRVWTREPGTIPEFIAWCKKVGAKLQDETIDTTQIIQNVLIPEEVERFPDEMPLAIEWPVELLHQSEERIVLSRGPEELPISMFDLQLVGLDVARNRLEFQIVTDPEAVWASLTFTLGGSEGFRVTRSSADAVSIRVGQLSQPIEEYLSNYPPLVRFIDLSELDGNLLIKPQNPRDLVFPTERFEVWGWNGVDTTKESMWKNGSQRTDSIQWKAARHFIEGGFEVVVDDDGSGEAADLICLKEEDDCIRLALVHCKYTKSPAGERVKDVVEVCSQAVRSAKWKGEFKDLCRHVNAREKRAANGARGTRFLAGRVSDLNKFIRLSRFKEIKPEILIVQPGVSLDRHNAEQTAVLASAYNYLKETIDTDLDVICSA